MWIGPGAAQLLEDAVWGDLNQSDVVGMVFNELLSNETIEIDIGSMIKMFLKFAAPWEYGHGCQQIRPV